MLASSASQDSRHLGPLPVTSICSLVARSREEELTAEKSYQDVNVISRERPQPGAQ